MQPQTQQQQQQPQPQLQPQQQQQLPQQQNVDGYTPNKANASSYANATHDADNFKVLTQLILTALPLLTDLLCLWLSSPKNSLVKKENNFQFNWFDLRVLNIHSLSV